MVIDEGAPETSDYRHCNVQDDSEPTALKTVANELAKRLPKRAIVSGEIFGGQNIEQRHNVVFKLFVLASIDNSVNQIHYGWQKELGFASIFDRSNARQKQFLCLG
jgi:hypothetical protein